MCADKVKTEKGVYYYPPEVEMQLMESVKSGNLKNVNEIIDNIIIENFINNTLMPETSRCLFFNLMGTAFKIINVFDYKSDDIFGKDVDCYKKVLSCHNIQDMEAALREIFYAICIYINSNLNSEETLTQRLIEHIKINSSDQNLSLISVASAFNLNSNYLSSYFKEQIGENFLGYVRKIRLEKAKELLANTDLSINDIAMLTGFSGDAVFIRNFKKYEGCTPGKYRETYSQKSPQK